MLDHPIIDVALALILFYVIMSLTTSAVQEWIASALGLRSKNLHKGIRTLVGEVNATKIYEHPLVRNMAKPGKLPSYIDPKTISAALLDIIAKDNGGQSYASFQTGQARSLVNQIPASSPVRGLLDVLVDRAEAKGAVLEEELSNWFDEGMTRVSGWYKRQAQLIIVGIAVGVTVALNASSIHFAEELWRNDALRTSIAAQAQIAATAPDASGLASSRHELLQDFPIGWSDMPTGATEWLSLLLGWLITVAAISLGAPFWFDLLGKVANLRGSGGKAAVSAKNNTS